MENKYFDSSPQTEYGYINSNQFSVNPITNNRFWVAENFYNNPEEVRNFALMQWYYDDPGYLGLRTRKQFFFDGVKEKMEKIMNKTITKWEEYEMNGRFQSSKAGIKPVYHCDSQQYAAAVYLTPDAPTEAGTCFYMHKKTKLRGGEENIMEAFNQHTFVDSTPYVKIDEVGNIFNRIVIWDARLIHAAPVYFGWDINSSRLFQLFFFDAK